MPEPDQPSPQVSSGDTSVDPDAPVAKPADVAPVIDAEEHGVLLSRCCPQARTADPEHPASRGTSGGRASRGAVRYWESPR